jgi:hypothetical protein
MVTQSTVGTKVSSVGPVRRQHRGDRRIGFPCMTDMESEAEGKTKEIGMR